MATVATFPIHPLSEQRGLDKKLPKFLKRAGCRVDRGARTFIRQEYRSLDGGGFNGGEFAKVTPRELGCTEPPLLLDFVNKQRFYAGSRKLLREGLVFDDCEPEPLIKLCVTRSAQLGTTLTAGMRPQFGHILQSVRLPESLAREGWLYGVPWSKWKRWSLDHSFLLRVRPMRPGERVQVQMAEYPEQSPPDEVVLCSRKPTYIVDSRPGSYCAQLAARSIAGAYGHKTEDDSYFKHALPWQVTWNLEQYGIEAPTHFWRRSEFERKLEAAIRADHLVNVVLYAQRREHGQHNQVVSGFMRYGERYYWMVTDGQFGEKEFDLPSGNVLLSTEDLIRSFPKYLSYLGLDGQMGAFVNVVLTK